MKKIEEGLVMPNRILQAAWHAQQALQLIIQVAEELQQEKDLTHYGYPGTTHQHLTNNTYGMPYPVGYQPLPFNYNQQPIQPTVPTYGIMHETNHEQPGNWPQGMQGFPQAMYPPYQAGTKVPVVWNEPTLAPSNAPTPVPALQNAITENVSPIETVKVPTAKKSGSPKTRTVRKNEAETTN
jgi:hypothetical protein